MFAEMNTGMALPPPRDEPGAHRPWANADWSNAHTASGFGLAPRVHRRTGTMAASALRKAFCRRARTGEELEQDRVEEMVSLLDKGVRAGRRATLLMLVSAVS